ncbi:MAG: DNA internalization-related competence protein ComEC/Rec2 [Nitrospinae bacterium]|nr:DNA internalization-related competence protein ComEC/Rec2 [Nitrospinota bacterium]
MEKRFSCSPPPALWFTFFFAGGVALGRGANADPFLLASAFIGLAVVFFNSVKPLKTAFAIALIGGFLLSGAGDGHEVSSNHLSRLTPPKRITAFLEIVSRETERESSTRYLVNALSIDGSKTDGQARLTIRSGKHPSLLPGDVVVITSARFKKPRGYRNVGGFDYETYLADRGINGDFSLGSKSKIFRADTVFNWRRPLEITKAKMRERLKSADPEVTALNYALVIGDDGLVTQETRDDFSRAGVAHILSVSGLHIGFAAAACYYAIKLLIFGVAYPLRREWASAGVPSRVAAVFALVAAVLYGALTGFKFPAMRSTIMAGVYLVAFIAGRGRDFYGAFALAFFIIILFYPWAIFDVGFQLSFGAVLFIVLFMEKWWKPFFALEPGERGPATYRDRLFAQAPVMGSGLAMSVFATIGTAPVVAYHFNMTPLYGMISNAVVVPVSSLAVPIGLFASLTGAPYTGEITGLLTGLVGFIAQWTAQLPYSYRHMATIPPVAVAFYYMAVGAVLFIEGRRIKLAVFAVAAMAFVAAASYKPMMARMDNGYTIRFTDVGQGDATIVLWPGGSMAIDGGPRFDTFDPGRAILAPILWREGRASLSAMIATHDDRDHSGGLAGFADRIPPALFMDNGGPVEDGSPVSALRKKFAASYKPLVAGDRITFPNGPTVETLNPPPPPYPYADEHNNRSLALKIHLGPVRVLMMGDVSKETEQWLLQSGADLKADVIKIAHHGSDTSSSDEFLDAVGAKTVIISVGHNNVHKHPSRKVLDRLNERGMRVLRTDRHGEITLNVKDGKASFGYYSLNTAMYGK